MSKKKPSKINRAIYIDFDLDARMKKAGDVNWSAVASAAFQRELDNRTSGEVMSSVVERLRAQKSESTSHAYECGENDGREFVTRSDKHAADYDGLYKAWSDRKAVSWIDWPKIISQASSESVAEMFGAYDAEDFWRFQLGGDDAAERANNPDYLRGFVNGAIDAFEEVKDQL